MWHSFLVYSCFKRWCFDLLALLLSPINWACERQGRRDAAKESPFTDSLTMRHIKPLVIGDTAGGIYWAGDSYGKSNKGSSPSRRQHLPIIHQNTNLCPMKQHWNQHRNHRMATDCNDVFEMIGNGHGCQAFIGFIHLLWMQPSRRYGIFWSCYFLNPGKIDRIFVFFDNLETRLTCIETFLGWPIAPQMFRPSFILIAIRVVFN